MTTLSARVFAARRPSDPLNSSGIHTAPFGTAAAAASEPMVCAGSPSSQSPTTAVSDAAFGPVQVREAPLTNPPC